jgi:hypothetical protein
LHIGLLARTKHVHENETANREQDADHDQELKDGET